MKKIIGVYGASGFGKEVMPLVKQDYADECELVFVDDGFEHSELNGLSVYSYEQFLAREEDKSVVIAIANSQVRQAISEKLSRDGIEQLSVVAHSTVVLDCNDLSKGIILCPFTTITSNTKIGKGFHANIYSYVAHDCVIGDYVTFAPSVKCNGNVHIEDHAYIGTGAMIKQGTPEKPIVIGKGAVVGMGAVVTKSVKPGDVVFGVPAKSIKRGK
ncbi:acetyltransferase [Vibrio mytili]|uniref:acetyltransferase n=1 Tax=Vibrio mytili TaxID=50718 RepID=UPI002F3EFA69